jgi:hypothetical protein
MYNQKNLEGMRNYLKMLEKVKPAIYKKMRDNFQAKMQSKKTN